MKNVNEHNELSKLKKENPFLLPNGYLDNLQEKVNRKIEVNAKLEKLKKDTGFIMPNNYFDSLNQNVLRANESKIKLLVSYKNIAYAASFAAIFLIGFMVYKQSQPQQEKETLLASNQALNSLTVQEYVNAISEMELPMDGIIFEDYTIDKQTEIKEIKEVINASEQEIDVFEIIDYQEEYLLF